MYLDPGSGSVIIQAVLAAVLGVGVFIKIYWGKIKSIFGSEKNKNHFQEESVKDQKSE